MDFEILPSTLEDAEAISTLVNAAYRGDTGRQGWTTEADLIDGTRIDTSLVKEIINKLGGVILKYVESGEILGCVELQKEGHKLYLGMLTVNHTLQGKGIGKKLMQAAEEWGVKQNCTSIFMNVLSERSELIAWYVRYGFHDSGKRKPFAFNDPRLGSPKKPLEFIIMEKPINKGINPF